MDSSGRSVRGVGGGRLGSSFSCGTAEEEGASEDGAELLSGLVWFGLGRECTGCCWQHGGCQHVDSRSRKAPTCHCMARGTAGPETSRPAESKASGTRSDTQVGWCGMTRHDVGCLEAGGGALNGEGQGSCWRGASVVLPVTRPRNNHYGTAPFVPAEEKHMYVVAIFA